MKPIQLSILLLMCCAVLSGQAFCPLVVSVVNLSGSPVSGVPVTVEEASGRTVREVTRDGVARFCDLGVSNVSVAVGASSDCNYVVVRNVQLAWLITKETKVMRDPVGCREDLPPLLLCNVLLRFKDETGHWQPDVVFSVPIKRLAGARSDSFGRVMIALANHEDVHAIAVKDGFSPQTIDLSCPAASVEKERIVTLKRR